MCEGMRQGIKAGVMSRGKSATPSRLTAGKTSARGAAGLRLGTAVGDVSRLWRVALDRALKPLGVTRSQYSVISFLSHRDGMTQTALASDLELTKVAVGGLLARMESAGLVERRADATDARVRRVYLTRKGASMIDRIRKLADPIEAEMLAPIGDEALESTLQTLTAIRQRLLDANEGELSGE